MMVWSFVAQLLALVLDLLTVRRCTERAKDLEIALLRQQLRLLQRQQPHPPRLHRADRTLLAVLVHKVSSLARRTRYSWQPSCLLVSPATILRWHRELVRRKWTFKQHRGGRPPLAAEVEALTLRLARENPQWGYKWIEGELAKLGHRVGRSTVRDLLKRADLPPAPERSRCGVSWRTFCRHYREHVLACDLRAVLHRGADAEGPPGWLHRIPHGRLGDPAGAQPGLAAAGWDTARHRPRA
jgi:transposase